MFEKKINHHDRAVLAGRIICDFGQSTMDCVVCRISDHGATIEVESPRGMPEHFHLLIPGEGVPRPCKLAWQSGKELRLEFEHADAVKPGVQPNHPDHRQIVRGQMMVLKLALDEIQIGVLLLGSDMRAQFMNRAFRKMWNVSVSMAEKKPAFVALLYHSRDTNAFQKETPDLDAFIAERIRRVKAGDTTPLDLRRSNGDVIRAHCTVLPNGARLLTYTLVTDIVRHSDELEVLRNALDNIQDGVLLLDADLNAQFVNRRMREYWGITEVQAAAHPAYVELIAGAPSIAADDAPAGPACTYPVGGVSAVRTIDPDVQDIQIPDGRYIRVHCAQMANGGRMLTYCDVTDLIRNAEQLERLATIDSMTGLYNRRHFLVLAEVEWSRFQRYHRPLSMLMIDIDYFKSVNDRYGHAVGDQGIKSVATACHEGKRGADSVGRIGGEEFAILLPETDQAQAWILAERIRQQVAGQVLSAQGDEFSLTISVGIAEATASMPDVETLLRAADRALYQAKFDGRNRTAQWSPELAPELAVE